MSETTTPELTSSQTIGPFFKYGLAWEKGEQAFPAEAAGEKIEISGRLIDGAGAPINDSMIEFWQADGSGRFGGPVPGSCAGFARACTDADGRYRFTTRKPAVPADEKGAAPHILVCLFSRGMLKHLYTRPVFRRRSGQFWRPGAKGRRRARGDADRRQKRRRQIHLGHRIAGWAGNGVSGFLADRVDRCVFANTYDDPLLSAISQTPVIPAKAHLCPGNLLWRRGACARGSAPSPFEGEGWDGGRSAREGPLDVHPETMR